MVRSKNNLPFSPFRVINTVTKTEGYTMEIGKKYASGILRCYAKSAENTRSICVYCNDESIPYVVLAKEASAA